jgi:hypothetical protein
MPPTETVERRSTRDAAVPETRTADAGLPLWMPIVIALGAVITVAWVGALVALAWWLIRTVLL